MTLLHPKPAGVRQTMKPKTVRKANLSLKRRQGRLARRQQIAYGNLMQAIANIK